MVGRTARQRIVGGWVHDALVDLEWERWAALDDSAAQVLATRIAAQVGAESAEIRPHTYAGRNSRTAIFDIDGMRFALVAGREIEVGYDGTRFSPALDQAASYRQTADELGLPKTSAHGSTNGRHHRVPSRSRHCWSRSRQSKPG